MTSGPDPDIGSLLKWGADRLKAKAIEDYKISSESLLGHILGFSRSELLLNPKMRLDSEQVENYKNLIHKRSGHIPLQYLIGYVEFYNVKIKCDPRALIPRPETEILVEVVIKYLENKKSSKILDIGTGSGNIAIALAKNIAGSRVTGIDISGDALELARENAVSNQVEDRVGFIKGDILDATLISTLPVFDCIVANPPYVSENERSRLQPEVIDHEPSEALFSYGDPLKFFKTIANSSEKILRTGGLIAFEIGNGQYEEVKRIMAGNFINISTYKDLSGIERVVTGRLKD